MKKDIVAQDFIMWFGLTFERKYLCRARTPLKITEAKTDFIDIGTEIFIFIVQLGNLYSNMFCKNNIVHPKPKIYICDI